MNINNYAIGVFDSGVGGLTVTKEIIRQLPNEKIIYAGDNRRCPYGSRSISEVSFFTKEVVKELLDKDIKLLVIACNTATAIVLPELKKNLTIPIVGVIEPGARAGIIATRNDKIGVIGTENTIKSRSYEDTLLKLQSNLKVVSLACPKLVPVIETGLHNSEESEKIIAESISPLLGTNIDTLILGCTHYDLIKSTIRGVLGDEVNIISSNNETAKEIQDILTKKQLFNQANSPKHEFYTTGTTTLFHSIAEKWLETSIDSVRQIIV